jgi:hypothetical protein
MGIDFRGIRRSFHQRLEMLGFRAALTLFNLARLFIVKFGPPDQRARFAAEWETHDQETAARLETLHRQALFTNVGFAHSSWAGIKEYLVAIASLLLRTHEATKVGTIMYSVVSFPVWLGIIDELFSQEPLYSTLKPKWNKINGRLRGLKDTRDRLAHHTIYYGERSAGGPALTPARFDVRQKSQKYQPLDLDQTSKFIDSIRDVMDDLRAILDAMTALLKNETSQRKSSEPIPDPPPD